VGSGDVLFCNNTNNYYVVWWNLSVCQLSIKVLVTHAFCFWTVQEIYNIFFKIFPRLDQNPVYCTYQISTALPGFSQRFLTLICWQGNLIFTNPRNMIGARIREEDQSFFAFVRNGITNLENETGKAFTCH
jgi:hypothetical protein